MSLERLEAKVDKLTEGFNNFQLKVSIDVAKLDVKAKVWSILLGGLSGSLPAITVAIYFMLRK